MIDVDAALAEIRVAFEAYNALPETHDCESCNQKVHARQPNLVCIDCGKIAPVRPMWMERGAGPNGTWEVRVRIDGATDGFGLVAGTDDQYNCAACREVAAKAEREAAAKVAAAEAAAAAAEE